MSDKPTVIQEKGVVTLGTLKGGAAIELFDAELDKVLRNIEDMNTDHKTARRITVTVEFKPSEDRTMGDVTIKATTKLAGLKPSRGLVYFGRHRGQPVAIENDPQQTELFGEPAAIVDAAERREGSKPWTEPL